MLQATEGAFLILESSGRLSFYEDAEAGSQGRLVARGSLNLPPAASSQPMRLAYQRLHGNGRLGEAVVQWGASDAPAAELLVKPPQETGRRWCQVRLRPASACWAGAHSARSPFPPCGSAPACCTARCTPSAASHAEEPRLLLPPQALSAGLALELHVDRALADCAEVTVELEPSGHWFGGAHLIRQLWPLNQAAMELGPYYGAWAGERVGG